MVPADTERAAFWEQALFKSILTSTDNPVGRSSKSQVDVPETCYWPMGQSELRPDSSHSAIFRPVPIFVRLNGYLELMISRRIVGLPDDARRFSRLLGVWVRNRLLGLESPTWKDASAQAKSHRVRYPVIRQPEVCLEHCVTLRDCDGCRME